MLLVEDEAALREGVTDLLRGDGHDVVAVGDGHAAVAAGLAEPYEVVLLDLMLPGLPGLEVCRRLRGDARKATPILMLTARDTLDDKLTGLSSGADDYLTKPFSARELLARVRALGRRVVVEAEALVVDGASLDLVRLVVQRGAGPAVPLTPREAGLLRLLHRRAGAPVSRAEILEGVFGQRGDLQTRAVDMAIAVLRKKVERDPAQPRIILSVKGAGYTWGDGDRSGR